MSWLYHKMLHLMLTPQLRVLNTHSSSDQCAALYRSLFVSQETNKTVRKSACKAPCLACLTCYSFTQESSCIKNAYGSLSGGKCSHKLSKCYQQKRSDSLLARNQSCPKDLQIRYCISSRQTRRQLLT